METQNYRALVTPGRQVTTFSRDEVAKAVFVACYSREPTEDQAKRLRVCVSSRDGRDGLEGEWRLRLSFADEAQR